MVRRLNSTRISTYVSLGFINPKDENDRFVGLRSNFVDTLTSEYSTKGRTSTQKYRDSITAENAPTYFDEKSFIVYLEKVREKVKTVHLDYGSKIISGLNRYSKDFARANLNPEDEKVLSDANSIALNCQLTIWDCADLSNQERMQNNSFDLAKKKLKKMLIRWNSEASKNTFKYKLYSLDGEKNIVSSDKVLQEILDVGYYTKIMFEAARSGKTVPDSLASQQKP